MLKEGFLRRIDQVIREENQITPDQLGGQFLQANMKEIQQLWQSFVAINKNSPEVMKGIQLYIHFPFCYRTKCKYCMYASGPVASCYDEPLLEYLQSLRETLEHMAPILEGFPLRSFYLGGGTPSLMSEGQMDGLLERVFSLFCFQDNAEKTVENSAETCTREKIDLYRHHGINRVSFGVQSLDHEILRRNNRTAVPFETIRSHVEHARSRGIPYVNIDLMAGIEGVTEESLASDFRRIAHTPVTSITVYLFRHIRKHMGGIAGDRIVYLKDFHDRASKQVEGLFAVAGSTHLKYFQKTIVQDNHFNSFARDPLQRYETTYLHNVSTLGIGPGALSCMRCEARYRQDVSRFSDWFREDIPLFYLRKFSPAEQMGNFIANLLYYSSAVRVDQFNSIFRADFRTIYRDVISLLEKKGWGEFNGEHDFVLTREGRTRKSLVQYLFYDLDTLKTSFRTKRQVKWATFSGTFRRALKITVKTLRKLNQRARKAWVWTILFLCKLEFLCYDLADEGGATCLHLS